MHPYITTEKMIGRVAIEKYGPIRSKHPHVSTVRPIATEILEDTAQAQQSKCIIHKAMPKSVYRPNIHRYLYKLL